VQIRHFFFSIYLAAAMTPACPSATAQSGSFAERDARYRLEPTDVLEVHYRYTPEFDQTVTVQPDGFISLQIAGDIKAQALTVEQVKAAILERSNERLEKPEITVTLKEFNKPYIVVGGEVEHPGRFEMRGSVTAIEAIAMAGGFKTASAKHSHVILYRRAGPDLAKTEVLNLKAATSVSGTEPLPDLRPGDVLVVPQNRVSKVERYVKWASLNLYKPF
jgi:polysaccharide export outer membrane protein